MIEIMQNQDQVFAPNARLPDDAKKMALGIMQVTNGTALLDARLIRINHDEKLGIPPNEAATYLAVLAGQVICLIKDEAPAISAGEVWLLNSKEQATIVNKSGDDAVMLYVATKVLE